jgi:hypothetical protein
MILEKHGVAMRPGEEGETVAVFLRNLALPEKSFCRRSSSGEERWRSLDRSAAMR